MSIHNHETRSHLFTVRVWPEEMGDGSTEWRGKVQYATNGETLYFRDWEAMLGFLLGTLDGPAISVDHKGTALGGIAK
jgi:hypothetical protein